ncbi:unnamed protein product [Phytophthora fragariaefolia]|uniref:Unnamed protein product n=1 Tax=Phytophthora fragariaefolia TaxID=1490495 RepID=A0A9W6X0M9_9STRA|nr:unnamed protein product [Phytophthora fragariaefolia]
MKGGGVVQEEDVVRPSHIDTSVVLSQNTVDGIFCPSSDIDVELSQAAVTRAFSLSLGDLQDHDNGSDAADAAAGLHMLSEVSGLESGGKLDDEQADLVAEQAVGLPFRQRLQEVKDDANILQDGEDSCDYVNYSSGVSDVDGMCDDEVEPGCGQLSNDEDVLPDSDAVEMDTDFLVSLQVVNSALSRAAVKDREEILREMTWTPVSSEYESDTPAYPGLGSEEVRPLGELLDVWRPPILTLFYFMPKSLWVMIATETNRYGLQQVRKRASDMYVRQSGNRRETDKQIARRLKAQQSYDTHEILHVVGLLVARMLWPQKRFFSAHWSMVEDDAVPAGSFGRYMTRDRCQKSMQNLHFVDNETAENRRDKLWMLRPVVDRIQERFLAGWSLPFIFSFDEGVLPATSKRNTTRMFMSDKPHRYGSKLFMTCNAKTSYCRRYEVYVGKRVDASGTENAVDYETGAAAVVRNLKVVLADPSTCGHYRPVLLVSATCGGAPQRERLRRRHGYDESPWDRPEHQDKAEDTSSKLTTQHVFFVALYRHPEPVHIHLVGPQARLLPEHRLGNDGVFH